MLSGSVIYDDMSLVFVFCGWRYGIEDRKTKFGCPTMCARATSTPPELGLAVNGPRCCVLGGLVPRYATMRGTRVS